MPLACSELSDLFKIEWKLTFILGIEQNGDASCIFLLQHWFIFIPELLSEVVFLSSVGPKIPLTSELLFLSLLLNDPGRFFRMSVMAFIKTQRGETGHSIEIYFFLLH